MYAPNPLIEQGQEWKQLSFAEMMDLPEDGYPYLVFTDNATSWFSRKIKKHTAGQYSHVLWRTSRDHGISQDWILREINFPKRYLKGKHRIKVWKVKTTALNQRYGLFYDIKKQLHKPWYKKLYDWPGVIGHLIHLRWINYSWRRYCSESVGEVLSLYTSFDMKHPSPYNINRWCDWHPDEMECVGVYEPKDNSKELRSKRLYNQPLTWAQATYRKH